VTASEVYFGFIWYKLILVAAHPGCPGKGSLNKFVCCCKQVLLLMLFLSPTQQCSKHLRKIFTQWRTEGGGGYGGLEPPHWRAKKILIGLLQPHSSDRHSKADPSRNCVSNAFRI